MKINKWNMSFLPKIFNALSRHTNKGVAVATVVGDTNSIEVTPEYNKVLDLIEGGAPITLVSGAGGTGKSTLIKFLEKTLRRKIVKLAPTGVAAINVGGQTLHSFFQLPHQILTKDHVKRIYQKKLYQQIGLLVIDEVSMVRPDVLDAIDHFLRINGPDGARPFGGVQLLLIGDHFQLPPVTPTSEDAVLRQMGYNFERHYWFHAKCVQDLPIEYVELTHIYRQTDAHFINLLSKIRVGNDLANVIKEINEKCFDTEYQSDLCTTVTATNRVADFINQAKFDALPGQVYKFEGYIDGKFAAEKEKLPSPSELFLKKGTRVMFTKNDSRKRWVNGSTGIVEEVDEKEIRVKMLNSSLVYSVEKAKWQNLKYVYNQKTEKLDTEIVGEYVQYPLKWGWAITIHKAQGKTLDEIIIDLGNGGAFETGQVYVALSRCRTLENIHLRRPLNLSDVKWCPIIKEFDDYLSGRMEKLVSIGEGELPEDTDDLAKALEKRRALSGELHQVIAKIGKAISSSGIDIAGLPGNESRDKSYEPWDETEDDMLRLRFQEGIPIKDIAKLHARTIGAIRSRLDKLGVTVEVG
nr:hypothetical protein [uncultured bacterium]